MTQHPFGALPVTFWPRAAALGLKKLQAAVHPDHLDQPIQVVVLTKRESVWLISGRC